MSTIAYDYILKFDNEILFLYRSNWGKAKFLYLLARYVPFCLLSLHLFCESELHYNELMTAMEHFAVNFDPNEDPEKCELLNNICFSMISLICTECIFVIRTYALWGCNKRVLFLMLVSFIVVLGTDLGMVFAPQRSTTFATVPIPAVTGCYEAAQSKLISVPFALLILFELGIVSAYVVPIVKRIHPEIVTELLCLTLIRATKRYRDTGSPLFYILLQHNTFYFSCGILFSVVNLLAILLLKDDYGSMFEDFQIVMHAVLVTRMHLHLWTVDRAHINVDSSSIPLASIN
ncbi:hypothetical protein BV22DRAFT_1126987 [Leucogyrophana mollusca]|uniref:Uncharacterized protein n=1 Tax=Leucogyrophana mollusca TaxID=85980 RepID=A0ACB8BTL4_9AGAM|nr:hypothetical protein BV22DRAFT_1126987 [Leucogyrophana mollusca]